VDVVSRVDVVADEAADADGRNSVIGGVCFLSSIHGQVDQISLSLVS
jgi:hypothetical protein